MDAVDENVNVHQSPAQWQTKGEKEKEEEKAGPSGSAHKEEEVQQQSYSRRRKQALRIRLENCPVEPESEVVTLKIPTRLYSRFYECLETEGWSAYITTPKY